MQTVQMWEPAKPLVVLLFGGRSGEHQISCATAGGVLEAIDRERWDVKAVGITPDGQWVPASSNPETYALGEEGGYTVQASTHRVAFLPGSAELVEYKVDEHGLPIDGTLKTVGNVSVVFPLLHGPFGEDGTVQGLLEFSDVNYVGCGVASSAICQDKALTKVVLQAAGIDVGRWVSFSKRQWDHRRSEFERKIQELGYPVFVKPNRAGSSLGVAKVDSPEELEEAINEAHRHDSRLIVERAVKGREVECGVLTDASGTIHTSELGEIKVQGPKFYDFDTKYFDPDAVALQCPTDLDMDVSDRIRETAKRAFESVLGEGISRVDFFYDDDTGNLVLNEINTMPGFTPFSMYPTMFAKSGLAYVELVQILLEEAKARPKGLR